MNKTIFPQRELHHQGGGTVETIFRILFFADIHRSARESWIDDNYGHDGLGRWDEPATRKSLEEGFSCWHNWIFGPEDLWPRHLGRLRAHVAGQLVLHIIRSCYTAWQSALTVAREYQPHLIAIAGDATGGFWESGMGQPFARTVAAKVQHDASAIAPTRMAGGNHESGYGKARGHRGGFRPWSIKAQQEVFGPLWWQEDLGSLRVVGVCSPLDENRHHDAETGELAHKQQVFLQQCAVECEQRPWVLVAHDLGAAWKFASSVEPAVKNLQAFVVGDLHSPGKFRLALWFAMLLSLLTGKFTVFKILRKAIFCPSTAPLWWEGFGALKVEWNDSTQKLTWQHVQLKRPDGYIAPPTVNFWTCLKWCFF